ncbi:MAG: alpha/beta hydrolase-fold protein [Ferruginibacter sp.]
MRCNPILAILFSKPRTIFLQALFTCCSLVTFSQYTVSFRLVGLPSTHIGESVYVAGSFNGWNPATNTQRQPKRKEPSFIQLDNIVAGEYQFKFTRGSWQTVECKANGEDADNRIIKIASDTIISVSISSWKDNFTVLQKKHTASSNVQIIDTAFLIPQLGRTRRIWMYLPAGYESSSKRYPVMYMQDGQNLFDDNTSGFGEWGIDESVDSMVRKGKPGCIIVGIDNGPRRLNEYNPYEFKSFGAGEGDLYLNFIVKTLKPFIDDNYRTLTNPLNTIIAGSSMGGLIAYYAMLKYPDVFGKAGIFSPAFWTAEGIRKLTDSAGKKIKGTLFFYIGGKEGDSYISDMKVITDKLGQNSTVLMYVIVDPDGNHNERAWRKWFPEFYNWVLATNFNNVIKLEKD